MCFFQIMQKYKSNKHEYHTEEEVLDQDHKKMDLEGEMDLLIFLAKIIKSIMVT